MYNKGKKMDYKNMSDSELTNIMADYITRVSNLHRLIGDYLYRPEKNITPPEQIKEIYTQLKAELREAAHYLELRINSVGSKLYMNAFSKCIRETATYGFLVSTNSSINCAMLSAVEEALYRLRKFNSLANKVV